MARTMYADFSDEAYDAFMRGEAVDNNGLRSRKGNYYPDQPTFRAKPTAKEQLQEIGVDIACEVGEFIILAVVCTAIKRRKQRAGKKVEMEQKHASSSSRRTEYESNQPSHEGVILDLEKYRKGA